jgi:hypothetical protein
MTCGHDPMDPVESWVRQVFISPNFAWTGVDPHPYPQWPGLPPSFLVQRALGIDGCSNRLRWLRESCTEGIPDDLKNVTIVPVYRFL